MTNEKFYSESGEELCAPNLECANLRGKDLRRANLHGFNLRYADLSGAILRYADLTEADLSWADMRGARLGDADLSGANLHHANLRGADLDSAELIDADLQNAVLSGASLRGAYLLDANLSGTKIDGAIIEGARLEGALNVPYIPMVPPEEGEFIAYMEVCASLFYQGFAKILVPANAQRSSDTFGRCRCSKATVLEIWRVGSRLDPKTLRRTDISPLPPEEVALFWHRWSDTEIYFRAGEEISVAEWDPNRWKTDAKGIRFEMSKEDFAWM